MMVDGIPHIVIREAVDVHVEVAVGIHVDVRDENVRQAILITTH